MFVDLIVAWLLNDVTLSLTSFQDDGGWLALRSGRFNPEKDLLLIVYEA
jgi:hypothetical protein